MSAPPDSHLPALNPELDVAHLRERFARDDRLRIDALLAPGAADTLATVCRERVPFDQIYHLDGANHVRTSAEMAALTPEARRALVARVLDAASSGVGFWYEGYRLGDRPETPELEPLYALYRFLNGEAMLEFVRRVSGHDDLVDADAQVTRYRAGHFLTRHRDDVRAEARRVAYVLNLTERWHPDWGGLLQFYRDDGTPRDAWCPALNVLSLFDVRHVHAVTCVAPFAAAPRLAVTGWFRGPRD